MPNLVKAYVADFCGTATLSGASRELVESFIPISRPRRKKTGMPWSATQLLRPTCGGQIMRRHIPGLHSGEQDLVSNLDGLFLVR